MVLFCSQLRACVAILGDILGKREYFSVVRAFRMFFILERCFSLSLEDETSFIFVFSLFSLETKKRKEKIC